MIKPVLRMGDPLLFARSEPVTQFDTPELHALLQDMDDTCVRKMAPESPRLRLA